MSFDDTGMDIEEERIKLFNEVWKEPMVTVAKRYGLSDNGLRKRCIKLEIPLPPVGYWAKIEAGKPVTPKLKLPPLNSNHRNEEGKDSRIIKFINPGILSAEELAVLDGLGLLTKGSKERFLSWFKNIRVPKRVAKYHPLIYEYQNEITYRKERDEEHQFRDVLSLSISMQLSRSNIQYRKNKAVLPICVSDKLTTRALGLMDTLIRLVNELDGSVVVQSGEDDNSLLRLFGRKFLVQLTEIMVKRRSLLLNPELQNRVNYFKPMYERVPSGVLEIEFIEIEDHQ
jgi:hypothetical protein